MGANGYLLLQGATQIGRQVACSTIWASPWLAAGIEYGAVMPVSYRNMAFHISQGEIHFLH